jgi:DNA-binding response OmpR family regulator
MSAPDTILIIEDHPATAQMISEVLGLEGFATFACYDGGTGIKKAKEILPDLILLDLVMTGIDGVAVCRRLKEDPATSEIPIVIVSARGSIEDKKRCFEAGCADYIVKPFELKELVEAVRKWTA